MNEKNLMHVKLEFEEARSNKKEILALEIGILKLLTTIKKYHELRLQELSNKKNINTLLKKFSSNITKIKKVIPNVQLLKKYDKRTKKSQKEPEEKAENPITLKKKKSDVEEQLQDIQKRLEELDEKF